MTDLTIRPYQRIDQTALLHIACETAFFGAPVEAFLDDRRLFEDAMYRYYVDHEPQHAWVASQGGRVVGFLAGCTDSQARAHVFSRRILPSLLWKAVRGQYRLGRLTLRYGTDAFLGSLRGEFAHVDFDQYPAHLHINLLPEARGQGAGTQLIQAYLSQLRGQSISGVHLFTTSHNQAAVHVYQHCGFKLLDHRPTRLWHRYFSQPIENQCYGQLLT
jgi:ribosomal protein S18 acetylase RimI-like enzyme